jgi:hypothetical protein
MTDRSGDGVVAPPTQEPEVESEELAAELRSALKGEASDEAPPPDVLAGFQKKLRERSGGKFYEDGWSTSRHPPINTYLITSLIMLAVLAVIYALLAPLSGEPVPVENTPQPVQIIGPAQR